MNIGVLEAVQVVVRHQRIVGRQLVNRVQKLAVMGNDGRWHALRAAVAPRMGQLQDADGRIAILLQRSLARLFHQFRENLPVAVVYPHLRGIRTCLMQHCTRLKPYQPVLSMRIPQIATKRQLAWRAIGRGIEPLHRMHRKAVRNHRHPLYLQRLLQYAEIVLKDDFLAKVQCLNIGLQLVKATVIESLLLCHSSLFFGGGKNAAPKRGAQDVRVLTPTEGPCGSRPVWRRRQAQAWRGESLAGCQRLRRWPPRPPSP